MTLSTERQEPKHFSQTKCITSNLVPRGPSTEKRWGESGKAPLGPEHGDYHDGLRAQEGRVLPLLSVTTPPGSGKGPGLVLW